MSLICPTVLADNPHTFRQQLERVEPFAERLQIDLMDGAFAPSTSVDMNSIWLPDKIPTDIHLMFQNPQEHLDKLVDLKPNMVIVHVESAVDLPKFASRLLEHGIKCGAAVLPETTIESIDYILPHVHHLLIFGGKLGYFGGQADLNQLSKAKEARQRHKWLELGWDGGTNSENVRQIAGAGIDVINTGGFIQKSEDPERSYRQLVDLIAQP